MQNNFVHDVHSYSLEHNLPELSSMCDQNMVNVLKKSFNIQGGSMLLTLIENVLTTETTWRRCSRATRWPGTTHITTRHCIRFWPSTGILCTRWISIWRHPTGYQRCNPPATTNWSACVSSWTTCAKKTTMWHLICILNFLICNNFLSLTKWINNFPLYLQKLRINETNTIIDEHK